MMLAFVGQPGTNKRTIAEHIADRFDIDYITVRDIVNEEQLHSVEKHNDAELDRQITKALADKKDAIEDYVLCCDCAQIIAPEAISILLMSSISSGRKQPHDAYSQTKNIERYIKRDFDVEVYTPESFDIAVDTTCVPVEHVVTAIIQTLVDGYKGLLVPARNLYPTAIPSEFKYQMTDDPKVVIPITYNEGVYYVIGEHSCYRYNVTTNGVVRVNIRKKRSIHRCTFNELAMWVQYCETDFKRPMFERMLSQYCADNGFKSKDLAYLSLCEEGNPWNILMNLGYAIK